MTARPQTDATTVAAEGLHRPWGLMAILALVWFGLLALFAAFPALDLAAASAFFSERTCDPAQDLATSTVCGQFPAAASTGLKVLRYSLYYLPHLFGIVLLVLIIRSWKQAAEAAFRRKAIIYLAGLLAGPLLLVNGILKQVSHRPRPYETDLFGGALDFVAAGDFSGACLRNCSFISGEASGMGWVMCLGLIAAARFGAPTWPALAVACLTGAFLRVAFGGHYLSDAVLGFASSPLVLCLAAVIIGWPKPAGGTARP